MIAPALTSISKEFGIANEVVSSIMLSIFVLAYAIGPLFLGPLSEIYGRVIVFQASNLLYLFFNLGRGLAQTEAQMIIFRFLSGLGGSAPLAIGGGVLNDLFTAEERGRTMSMYSLAPPLGPAVGRWFHYREYDMEMGLLRHNYCGWIDSNFRVVLIPRSYFTAGK